MNAQDNGDRNQRIARNSIVLSLRMVVVLCISLFTTRLTLAALGVEDYGIYDVVCGFVSMFAFLNTSISNGIQRFYNYEFGRCGTEGAKEVYNVALRIQVVLVLVVILTAELIGTWYLYNKMVIPSNRMVAAGIIFQCAIVGFFFTIIQAPFVAAVTAHEKMGFFAFISVLDACLKLLIVCCLKFFTFDNLILYGVLIACDNGLIFFLYFFYCKKSFQEICFSKKTTRSLYKSMLSFSGWNIFGSLSTLMKEQGINLVINFFYGPLVNAARGVANQVNSGLQSFVQNITVPVRPQVIQSYAQGDIERTMKLTFSVSKLSCCLLYMVALPIVVEIDYVLSIWLGGNVPAHTSTFVFIIILTSFLNNLNYAISGVVHASGKMMLYQVTGGLIGLSSVPIAYFVLKFGGTPESALWVSFFVMLFAQAVALWVLKRIVNYSIRHYITKVVIPVLLLVLVTFFIPLIPFHLLEEGLLRLAVVVIVSITSVSAIAYFIVLDSSEKTLIRQFVGKLLPRSLQKNN